MKLPLVHILVQSRKINKTFYRLRLIVLIAVTTGMRASEILGLRWSDVMYSEGCWQLMLPFTASTMPKRTGTRQ